MSLEKPGGTEFLWASLVLRREACVVALRLSDAALHSTGRVKRSSCSGHLCVCASVCVHACPCVSSQAVRNQACRTDVEADVPPQAGGTTLKEERVRLVKFRDVTYARSPPYLSCDL